MAKIYLNLNQAAIIQYADLLKGDLTFRLVIPTSPAAGHSRRWGFYAVNKESGVYFEVSGATFQATVRDGINGTSSSVALTWNDDWANAETTFRVRWEAGLATFYINGAKVTTIALDDENVVLASSPLSIYIENLTTDEMLTANIDAVGVQSYLLMA